MSLPPVLVQRAVDLTQPGALPVPLAAVLGSDTTVPRHIGMVLLQLGITSLVVPAAITEVAHQFPQVEAAEVDTGVIRLIDTPTGGTNIVIFKDRLTPQDRIDTDVVPRERLVVRGLAP